MIVKFVFKFNKSVFGEFGYMTNIYGEIKKVLAGDEYQIDSFFVSLQKFPNLVPNIFS